MVVGFEALKAVCGSGRLEKASILSVTPLLHSGSELYRNMPNELTDFSTRLCDKANLAAETSILGPLKLQALHIWGEVRGFRYC